MLIKRNTQTGSRGEGTSQDSGQLCCWTRGVLPVGSQKALMIGSYTTWSGFQLFQDSGQLFPIGFTCILGKDKTIVESWNFGLTGTVDYRGIKKPGF